MFEVFKQKLTLVFGENLTAIYHIGSTSVEGLWAKPVIDIMPTVFSIQDVDTLKDRFIEMGFRWHGEYGIAGRRYLTFDDPNSELRLCQVHVFEASSTEVEKHLAFRDYMRAEPGMRDKYGQLKRDLFRKFPADRDAFHFGKEPFILKATQEALERPEMYRLPVQVYVWLVCKSAGGVQYLIFKRTPRSGGFWQGITGAPHAMETLQAAAVREVQEETGIVERSLKSLDFGYSFPLVGEWKKSYRPEVEKIAEYVFYIELNDPLEPRLSREHEAFRWCRYEECLDMLKWPKNKESLKILHQRLT